MVTNCLRVQGHANKAISLKKMRPLGRALCKYGNLVIKKADRGGAVVVWDKEMYVNCRTTQLSHLNRN